MDDLIICHCWDVNIGDLRKMVEAGTTDIEWIKRYTGLSTGNCQGRWCLTPALSWLRANYPSHEWTALPTARQPLYPVPVWKLAGTDPEEDEP